MYKSIFTGRRLIGVFSASPLMFAVTGSKSILKINLKTRKLEKTYWGNPFGHYDIARLPGADLFAADRFLLPGGVLMDFNLKKVKDIAIPRGVREIEFTRDGGSLLATGFFDGFLYFIDPIRGNRILKKIFVGKGGRELLVTDDGKAFVGTACGIVEVDLEHIRK